ncbi:MAG: dodecin domain-containing protein [Tissierellia bacterium]|nr:dodecin domain-containing protein [Tissierellia bacterium]
MAVVKVIELLSESANGWEAAVQEAVTEAAKTIENIKSVYVSNMQAIVEDNKVVNYRVNVKISFVVDSK